MFTLRHNASFFIFTRFSFRWDSVCPRMFVFIVPQATACIAGAGAAEVPAGMYTAATVWGSQPRVNNVQVDVTDAPYLGRQGPITAQISGMPEAADTYRAVLFFTDINGDLVGPAPACNAAAGMALTPVAGDAKRATVTFNNWWTANTTWLANGISAQVVLYANGFPLADGACFCLCSCLLLCAGSVVGVVNRPSPHCKSVCCCRLRGCRRPCHPPALPLHRNRSQ